MNISVKAFIDRIPSYLRGDLTYRELHQAATGKPIGSNARELGAAGPGAVPLGRLPTDLGGVVDGVASATAAGIAESLLSG